FGMCAALMYAQRTGEGQVIDAAICDGASLLMSSYHHLIATGALEDKREGNSSNGGAHFYGDYETTDGKFVAIGAIEPQFYEEFRLRTGLDADHDFDVQWDQKRWPALRKKMEALFLTHTRDEWCTLLENTDVCFAPVLAIAEVADHPHN